MFFHVYFEVRVIWFFIFKMTPPAARPTRCGWVGVPVAWLKGEWMRPISVSRSSSGNGLGETFTKPVFLRFHGHRTREVH